MSSAIPTSRRRASRIRASCSPGSGSPSYRLALPRPTRDLEDPFWTDGGFLLALERFGYDVARRHDGGRRVPAALPPELIDGEIDGECRAILFAVLLEREPQDEPTR